KYKCIERLPDRTVAMLDAFIQQSGICYPPEKEMEVIVNLLSAGLKGDEVTVFVPVCPDYTFEYNYGAKGREKDQGKDGQCPIKFILSDVGCGNGIIAQWILNVIKHLADTLNQCEIKTRFIVAMADFEAFSKDNLQIFNLTETEFLRRVS